MIAAAQVRVQIAAAQAEKANVLVAAESGRRYAYIRHTGGIQGFPLAGNLVDNSTNSFIAGGGAILRVGTADALFEPLAAAAGANGTAHRYTNRRNESLEITAESYFTVNVARHLRRDDRRHDQGSQM